MSDVTVTDEVDEAKDDVFNTFPDKTDREVKDIAIVAKAQVWQAVGELVRRGAFKSTDPRQVEDALGEALDIVILTAFLSGEYDSEHAVLQAAVLQAIIEGKSLAGVLGGEAEAV